MSGHSLPPLPQTLAELTPARMAELAPVLKQRRLIALVRALARQAAAEAWIEAWPQPVRRRPPFPS
ncbi:hypothetical protein [Sabulicella rubraurantiaca]|uniref:hypothetical protein n=1 Tax=Sabulicella rubraurantiaca TaxID=2811429 RepID=UPI001A96D7B9|nr:hypothetical protein [Sabulicella rubraurantiaca]